MEGRLSLGQYLILVILLLGQLHGFKSCIQKESKALLELKKYIISTNQEEFSDYVLPTWTNDTKSDCCQWEGVECNRTNGRVIALSVGRLFPRENFLLNLSLLHPFEDIRNLSLSPFRDIQDRPSIPVKEYNNQFSGFFDNVEGNNSLRRFRNLEILDLSFNKFNNSILPFLTAATSLTALSLKNNDIYGPAKVFCQMKNLRELNLRGNHFEGQLPLCLGSLKKLQVLDLSSNQFSGNLPSIFSSLESIEYLSLSDNNFTGLFGLNPLTNLTKLKVFKLSSTSDMVQVEIESSWQPKFQLSVAVLRSCSLEKIPSFLMYQKNLHLVDLSNNRLSGYIPTWILENNPELEVLQLQNNSFILFQMPTIVHNLQVLDFSSNAIEIFPVNIGKALPNLVHMNGSSNGFQGYFPSSIGEMKNISFLDLSSNNFSGKVPRSFVMGCISLKYLKLSHNKFSGRFLSSGTSFASLDGLIINNNLFTGKIGDGLISSSELFILDASNNFLRGAIPSWIYNSELQFLVLSNNLLEGTLPPSLLAMTFLDISGNLFSGALPAPPVGSISPKNLFLNNNNFTGPIPETLLDGVNILDLSNNKLSGSIPQFVNTQDISILLLRGNDLTGPIPRELCDLSNIKLLDLSNNKLNGFIPSCLYNLSLGRGGVGEMGYYRAYLIANLEWEFYKSTIVVENFVVDSYITYKEIKVKFATKQRYDSYSGRSEFSDGILDLMYGIDLSSNELSGVIPANLGNLSSVRALNFSHNFLSSSIPSSFSNLKVIESLDLSYNKLHGSIPYQLTSLTYLAVFDVSHNNLSGIIPQGRQFNTFSENSYLGNPLLCGPPTHISCEAKKSSEERDNGGGEEETEAAIDMLVFYYSTASVYVTALVGIVVLVCFDCPWRRAWLRIVDAFITSVKNVLS